MKFGKWSVKLVSLIACALICTRMIKKKCIPFCKAQKVVVHTDSQLSDSMHDAITQYVHEQNKTNSPTFYEMTQLLIAAFPCIKSVEIERQASVIDHYVIHSCHPVIGINQHWMLTDNHQLLLKNCFQEFTFASIGKLHVPSGEVTPCMRSYADFISQNVLPTHEISWISDEEIYLKDKEDTRFTLLCNARSLPGTNQLEKCKEIKHELKKIESIESKQKKLAAKRWIADIRFENQIIVSVDAGGQRYG